jgi:hypothetical protein
MDLAFFAADRSDALAAKAQLVERYGEVDIEDSEVSDRPWAATG